MVDFIMLTINYILVLLYGTFITIYLTGGLSKKNESMFVFLYLIFNICVQAFLGLNYGIIFTTKLYPLITHIPLVLFLVIGLKKPIGISFTSVLTSYFFCQLPRWVATMSQTFFQTTSSYSLAYTFSIIVFFFLLRKYFVKSLHNLMIYSHKSLLIFSVLPLFYYLFDYGTTIYTDALQNNILIINEFLPAFMALFYILFVVIYHNEVQEKNKTEVDNAMLSAGLDQAGNQIQIIKEKDALSRIYRHDMRHHLSLTAALLENEDFEEASDYIKMQLDDIQSFTPSYYSQNEVVNLVLSSFVDKASNLGVQIIIEMDLPERLPISKTELCAILSNGLENAINATAKIVSSEKTVKISSFINNGNLLLHIKNPYEGKISMKNGLPNNEKQGHGFGIRSINLLTKKYNGHSSISTNDNNFTLKVAIPLN